MDLLLLSLQAGVVAVALLVVALLVLRRRRRPVRSRRRVHLSSGGDVLRFEEPVRR